MPKRKNTVDLIVHHTEQHIAVQQAPAEFAAAAERNAGVAFFALAGIIVLTLAFQLVSFSQKAEQPVFHAVDVEHYAEQQAFYTGKSLTEIADVESAVESVHAAAVSVQTSKFVLFFGLVMICMVLFYLHHKHGVLSPATPHFTVRRIR
jgi:hypothetical protein